MKRSHVVLTHSHVVLTPRLCSSQCALLLCHIKSGRFLVFKNLRRYALYCSRIKLEGQMAMKEAKFIAGLIAGFLWGQVPTKAGRALKEANCVICLLK